MRKTALLFVLLVVLAACSSSGSPKGQPVTTDASTPSEAYSFPAEFLFGSATAGFQVEKGNTAADWWVWANTQNRIANGDHPDRGGPDALAHVDDDVALLTSSGQRVYRFSIEWSRLYPTREQFDRDEPDATAVASYSRLLDALSLAKIVPMVTLHHFASPSWLSDPTKPNDPEAWERSEMGALFATFAARVATRWGHQVDWWVTINEPLNAAIGGYVQGSFPPGQILAIDRALSVVKATARAHALAYDAIHEKDTRDADGDGRAAWVSPALHQRTFHPYDPESQADKDATAHVQGLWNRWFADVIVFGNWDDDFDGKLDGANDRTSDVTLRGRADYLGFNYYSDTLVSASRGIVLPVINAAIYQAAMPTERPKTDTRWDIYPEGMGTVLDELKAYGLPLFITENGIADAVDQNRARFVLEHLREVSRAISRGADVRGYLHWSLIDNFEWASGFCPRFGLATYDPDNGRRTERASLLVYTRVIANKRVEQRDIDTLPAYANGTTCP